MTSSWIIIRLRNVSENVVEKIKTHFMFSSFIPKIMPFVRQHGKYGLASLATHDNAVQPICFIYWMVHNVVPVIRVAYGQRNWDLTVFWQTWVPIFKVKEFGVYQSPSTEIAVGSVWKVMFWLARGHHKVLTDASLKWWEEVTNAYSSWELGWRGHKDVKWGRIGKFQVTKVSVVIKNGRWRQYLLSRVSNVMNTNQELRGKNFC